MARAAVPLTLGGIVLAAAAVWGALGQQLDVPTVFGDELIHWDASRSLADGDGLRVRDGGYGFAPGYPALLAPVHWLAPDGLTAYAWARLLHALVFSLAALPAYLLARRLLAPGWSLACAALSVALPSALYTGFVMTEGAAYAACTLAFLAFARCLERPTVGAQVGALATLALATAFRLQLGALVVVLVGGLALRALLSRGRPFVRRGDARLLAPLLVVLGALAVAAVIRVAAGNPLAGYGDLWRSYDLVEVARWTWRTIAGLGLYLALVPLVVAPAAMLGLGRDARRGNRPAAAFASLFLAANAVLLLVVGAFSSTEFGVGFLHDRYLFYVVPLWLVATASWGTRRDDVGWVGLGVGAASTIVLLATLPTYLLNDDGGRRFDAIASGLPSEAASLVDRAEPSRAMLLAFAVLAIVVMAVLALRRVPAWLVLCPTAIVFVLNAGLAWDYRLDAGRNTTFEPLAASATAWVDGAVPGGTQVATLAGGVPVGTRDALRLTELFNASIGPAYDLDGAGYAPTLAAIDVTLGPDGRLLADDGPVAASWVVAPRTLRLAGEVVAVGTVEGLRLWRVDPPLRVLSEAAP